jgi:drug/metabolite transporter superfamily protein YnfA
MSLDRGAAYGGIYVATAFLWMIFVDRVQLSLTGGLAVGLILLGSLVVVFGYGQAGRA